MSEAGNILICGTNWLGDSIMSMPAIQVLKLDRPACRVSLLTKRALAPLWEMHAAVDDVVPFDVCACGTLTAARQLRQAGFDSAYIFPNSFRSALIPFLAGIRPRTGTPGHWRSALLTDIVGSGRPGEDAHQSTEYMDILGLAGDRELPPPRLELPVHLVEKAAEKFHVDRLRPLVALIPGAARGASKRWPDEHFAVVGQWLAGAGLRVAVLGSVAEAGLCRKVSDAIGGGALNLAGRTQLPEFAAVLSLCTTAVTNDSGGMHLAAAVGLKVVAVFGLTDSHKTGPMGAGHRIVSGSGMKRSRDISRNSREAADCLRSIGPERVIACLEDILSGESE